MTDTTSNILKEISCLPVRASTLTSFGGHLLAVGGNSDSRNPTTDVYRHLLALLNPTSTVYRYDSHTDSWHVISQMKNKRSRCFSVTLPENQLIVVGGLTQMFGGGTDSVEILENK